MSIEEVWKSYTGGKRLPQRIHRLIKDQPFIGRFLDVVEVHTKIGRSLRYHFVLDDNEEVVIFNKSKRLLQKLKDLGVEEGDQISITRIGSGFETDYIVNRIEEEEVVPLE